MTLYTSFDKSPSVSTDNDKSALSLQRPHRRSWLMRIGRESCALILLGCLGILVAVALLCFLWGGDDNNSIWTGIMLSKKATLVVTVCSEIIRFSIGIQSGILTAMVASLVLEHYNIPLEEVALLSIVRATTVAPHHIFWPLLRTIRPICSRLLISTCLLLAVLVTVASQFTSTILLSDFGFMVIDGNVTVTELQYNPDTPNWGSNYWLSRPSSYPRFAEYYTPPLEGEDFVDTGPTYRAFLPIQSPQDRSSLRKYQGPAVILDARVTCVRPSINISSVVVYPKSIYENDSYDILLVKGTIGTDQEYPMLTLNESAVVEFTSLVSIASGNETFLGQTSYNKAPTEWQTSIHWIDTTSLYQYRSGSTVNPALNGFPFTNNFLLANSTGSAREWVTKTGLDLVQGFKSEHDWVKNITSDDYPSTWEFSDNGPWTTASATQAQPSIAFTLCFTQLMTGDHTISISSNEDGQEPIIDNTRDSKYGTDLIQRQLGATQNQLTVAERDIFSLGPPSSWTKLDTGPIGDYQFAIPISDLPTYSDEEGSEKFGGLLTSEGIGTNKGAYVVNPAHVALFQGILRTTENPAVALQALITVLTSMSYYDLLHAFSISAPATTSFSREVLAPIRWHGLIGVVIVISVHFLLLVIFVVLFTRSTSYSTIGNSWQAIAQVVSEDTVRVVDASADMTDKEVGDLIRQAGSETGFRLVKLDSRDRSEIKAV